MTFNSYQLINIDSAGGTFTIDYNNLPDFTWLFPTGGAAVTLLSDVDISNLNQAIPLSCFYFYVRPNNFDLNGNTFTILGTSINQDQLNAGFLMFCNGADPSLVVGNPGIANVTFLYTDGTPFIGTSNIIDESVTLSKLEDLSRGYIIVGNSSNRPTPVDANGNGQILIGDGTDLNSVAVSGDITINSSGVTAIGSGVIVNADINASAAITRSKIASGTASHVIINDGSGVLSSEAQLANTRGGTGINTSSSTGFPTINSGTWSVSPLTDSLRCDISFVTAAQGTYYIRVPYACTVTSAKARVTSTISGTDDGSITFKDNSGTNMTGGLITIPASSAHGTGVTCSMTANNTFTANQEIQLLVSKVTSGGLCSVDITITRNS